MKLGLGSGALATACAAFHRFARAVGPGAPHDPHLVAAAAIFLAGKAQGTPLRARDVLNVAHRYPPHPPGHPKTSPNPPGAPPNPPHPWGTPKPPHTPPGAPQPPPHTPPRGTLTPPNSPRAP